MKNLVGKRITKNYKFMGENLEIAKLTVSEVLEIQSMVGKEGDDEAGFDLLKHVIRTAVKEAEELTDDDFNSFPIEELSKLSNEIMKFSGMVGEQGK